MNKIAIAFRNQGVFEVVVNASELNTYYGYLLPEINYNALSIEFSDDNERHSPIDTEDVVLGIIQRLVTDNAAHLLQEGPIEYINAGLGQPKMGLRISQTIVCTSTIS